MPNEWMRVHEVNKILRLLPGLPILGVFDDSFVEAIGHQMKFKAKNRLHPRTIIAAVNPTVESMARRAGNLSIPPTYSALATVLLAQRLDNTILQILGTVGETIDEETFGWSDRALQLVDYRELDLLIGESYFSSEDPSKLGHLRYAISEILVRALLAVSSEKEFLLLNRLDAAGGSIERILREPSNHPAFFGVVDYDLNGIPGITCKQILIMIHALAGRPRSVIWTAHGSNQSGISILPDEIGLRPEIIDKHGTLPGDFIDFIWNR